MPIILASLVFAITLAALPSTEPGPDAEEDARYVAYLKAEQNKRRASKDNNTDSELDTDTTALHRYSNKIAVGDRHQEQKSQKARGLGLGLGLGLDMDLDTQTKQTQTSNNDRSSLPSGQLQLQTKHKSHTKSLVLLPFGCYHKPTSTSIVLCTLVLDLQLKRYYPGELA
ncbi:uncharacterized protein I303_108629 [Kwoniella dejecticola CBS 10117]|uniref:Uncharacterized protein n=1 Tax=Kwoniella dejecticola CBS 10117 TaxID=1296121 RepID=A0A1A5ZWV5_9TREE|nr:uncharacterized protein I303_07046 [Kwoniella dejecticola CBS 10117]OBR82287.1 hypothetical protein I303_07046 [Kwoniella dejecticola CBS 10117]